MPVTDQSLSLLWPPDADANAGQTYQACDARCIEDLDLELLVRALAPRSEHHALVREILFTLCTDPRAIVYRQAIVDDLLRNAQVCASLRTVLPQLVEISRLGGPQWRIQTPLQQTLWRLSELELYVDCVRRLHSSLSAPDIELHSEGLVALRDHLAGIVAEPDFGALEINLPELRRQMAGIKSLTIGVNLDAQLRPEGAILLSVDSEPFVDKSLFDKLLGRQSDKQGVGPLHAMPGVPGRGMVTPGRLPQDNPQPLMHPLFRDLNTVLMAAARPVAEALGAYVEINTRFLLGLQPEIVFYLGAVDLIERVRALGMPLCRPTILPAQERCCHLEDNYNLNLVLRAPNDAGKASIADEIVSNDVHLNDDGRIFILTGPNRGGKTTYTQAIGLTHVLAQAGLYVPAAEAALSPVDAIYTHFPAAERASVGTGRLGEEALRLSEIFQQATAASLVLLNESLFSTSPGESLYLARDVVRGLRLLGARAIYATHLHELAEDLDALNTQSLGSSTVISLVAGHRDGAGPDDARCTYRIEPGPPRGQSYAHEIASRYGISYEQLAQTLRARNLGEMQS